MLRHVLEFIWSDELWSFGVIKVLEKMFSIWPILREIQTFY
jgi:hypothetical protein